MPRFSILSDRRSALTQDVHRHRHVSFERPIQTISHNIYDVPSRLERKFTEVEERLNAKLAKFASSVRSPQVKENLAECWPVITDCDFDMPNVSGDIDLNNMDSAIELLDKYPPIKKHFFKLVKHVSVQKATSQRGSYIFVGAAKGLPALQRRVLKSLIGYFGKKATPFVDMEHSSTWNKNWNQTGSLLCAKKRGSFSSLDGAMIGLLGIAPFKWISSGKQDNAALIENFYLSERAENILRKVDNKGMDRFARACTKAKLERACPYKLLGASVFGIGDLNEKLLSHINAETILMALVRSPLLGRSVLNRDYNTTSKDVSFIGESPTMTIRRAMQMMDDLFCLPAMEVARFVRDEPDRTTADDALLLKHAVKSLQAKLQLDLSRKLLLRTAMAGYAAICKAPLAKGQELRLWMIGFAGWWNDMLKSSCGQSLTSSLIRLSINRTSIESLGRWFDLIAEAPQDHLRAVKIDLNARLDEKGLKRAELLRQREEEATAGNHLSSHITFNDASSSLAYWKLADKHDRGNVNGDLSIYKSTPGEFVCKKNCAGAGSGCYHCTIRNLQEAVVELVAEAKQKGVSLAANSFSINSGRMLPFMLPRYCL